jgi:drug/metabolite transporter (DMT)-like permease
MVNWKPILALVIGLLSVATAAIFIRLAQGEQIPSLSVAAGRLVIASLLLTAPALSQHRPQLKSLTTNELRLIVLSGVFLAIHFASWISSLEYTSVTNSVVLVTTSPLWVALLSPMVLNERLSKWVIAGLLLALLGGTVVALGGDAGEAPTRPEPLLGNGLAIIGAMAAAGYLMIGRQLRQRLHVITYIWTVYSVTAIFLVLALLITGGTLFGFSASGYLWIAMLGIVPQLMGHSSFNYALAFFPAVYVSIVTLAEPIGSSVLAMIFLNEYPGVLSIVGSGLILGGIAVASKEQLDKARRRTNPRVQNSEETPAMP